jgi:hypothetical protein
MDVNTISSVYERNVANLVKEAIAQENSGDIGVYYAKKEALTLPGAGVRFPTQLQQSIASTGIVHRFSEKVNMKISETVQSQQFKRWFGDWQNDPAHASKVVNEDGTPKVVYHGTNAEFTAFNSSNGTYWFSESRDYAESMAEERSGDVLTQAFLNVNMNAAQVLEEIVCDAMAEMNAFATEQMERVAGEVGRFLRDVQKAAQGTALEGGQKKNAREGVKYSLCGVNKDNIEVYETSNEIKALPYSQRKQHFLSIMENEYKGRTAKFERNGHVYYATFDEGDINKNIYGDKKSDTKGWKAKINVGADGNVFELVESAKYNGSKVETGKNISTHRGVHHWDYFVKNVQIDGTVFDLVTNVRKKTDAAFVYSIQLRVNKKTKASPPLGSLSRALDGVPNASMNSIRKSSRNVNSSSENQTETENFNPDIRYSWELTTDGRGVAVVDEDILSNLDLSNWNQETKETAQKASTRALLKFKGGIAVDGITRKVNRISRKEFTRSEYTNELFWWNSTAFLDKMRAANNLDDIVIAATDWARDGALKHPRTDNLVDFDHGTTLIASGDTKYEAEVVVGITDKGEAVFYDIVNMKPGNFSIKKEEPSTNVTTNESPDAVHEGSSGVTLAQQEQNVNQKHSRELETIEELKQQNELLKKQVDYWHSQTAVTVGARGMAEKFKRMALKPGKGDTQHAPQQLISVVTEFCDVPLHFCFQNRLKSRGKT